VLHSAQSEDGGRRRPRNLELLRSPVVTEKTTCLVLESATIADKHHIFILFYTSRTLLYSKRYFGGLDWTVYHFVPLLYMSWNNSDRQCTRKRTSNFGNEYIWRPCSIINNIVYLQTLHESKFIQFLLPKKHVVSFAANSFQMSNERTHEMHGT
jgi:hypothetical protein